MSPVLFSIFLNDIETQLAEQVNEGVTLDQLSLYLLMFADDAVLISESRGGLQKSPNNLETYCNKWNFTVNIEKNKHCGLS